MASNQKQGGSSNGHGGKASQRHAPEWAEGLKQLYDSVVEEDLPDSFQDLLDRLDGPGGLHGSNDNGPKASPSDDRGAGR